MLNLSVTTRGPNGTFSISNFVLNVLNVNDAPMTVDVIPDVSIAVGQQFEYSLAFGATPSGSILDDVSDIGTNLTHCRNLMNGADGGWPMAYSL
jgi:hypothetical protein